MSLRARILLCVLSGVLDPLGFAGFGLAALSWVAKVPVLIAVRDLPPLRTFAFAMVYGVIAYFGGYYWLMHTLETFAGMGPVAAWASTVLICAFLAVLFGLLLAFVQLLRRELQIAPVWSLAFICPTLEHLYPNIFPYNIGASQFRFTAVTQIIELTGLLGLSALVVLVNGALLEFCEARLDRRRVRHARWIVPLIALVFTLVHGFIRVSQIDARSATSRQLTVGLVQSNLSARDKMERPLDVIHRHRELTQELVAAHPEVELVIWPETSITAYVPHDQATLHHVLLPQRPMIVGAITRDAAQRRKNAALVIAADGTITGRYEKRALLPFGETIPYEDAFPWLRRLFPHSGRLRPGTSLHHLHAVGTTFIPTICYEDIQPARVREIWRQSGPAEAILNLSDDSWFGDTHEPRIHLALATFRAIEARRAFIRSTNTGISALIDPAGRIVAETGQHTRENLIGRIPLIHNSNTTLYLRHGEWFGWLCVAITAGALALVVRRLTARR